MNEKLPSKEDLPLADFKKEIAGLKKQEEDNLNADGLKKTVHFEDINPNELNETDKVIYYLLRSGELTVRDLDAHRKELQKFGNKSQKQFSAYIANKLFIQMYRDK